MTILAYACHEGVQESLLRAWVDSGHAVHLVAGNREWDQTRARIAEGVSAGFPRRADVISVGITQDIPVALLRKFRWLAPSVPVVMTHWWFPSTRRLARTVYRTVHHVSVCEFGQGFLADRCRLPSDVIYCPVDGRIFGPSQVDIDPKLVVTVGNHFASRPIMGWEKLAEVLRIVHREDPQVRFLMLGENPEIDTRDFPNLSIRAVRQDELPLHQAEARCAVFTTTYNLIPHSLLGAMALGKDVIAFDLVSLHEVIPDAGSGFLIPCYDVQAYARRILDLTSSPVDPGIGARARQNALARCDHQLVADQYIRLFQRLAG